MRLFTFAMAGLLGAVLLLFAWHAYPPPLGDAHAFLPAAVNLQAGRGLINPLWELAHAYEGLQGRYLHHGPLFPIVLAALMWSAAVPAAMLANALLNAASLFLAAWLYWRAFRNSTAPGERRWLDFLLMGAALLATASFLDLTGRPESLATLLFLATTQAALDLGGRARYTALAVGLGLTAATSPVAALTLGALILAYFGVRLGPKCAIGDGILVLVGGVLFFVVVLALSPHGLFESLAMQARFARLGVGETWDRGLNRLIYYWFTAPKSTFFGLVMLGGLTAGAAILWRGRHAVTTPWVAVAGILLFLGAVYYFSIRSHARNYNIRLFAPLFIGLILREANLQRLQTPKWRCRLVPAAAVGVLLLGAVGFLRTCALFPVYLTRGMGYEEARALVEEIDTPEGTRLGVTGALWALRDEHDAGFLWLNQWTADAIEAELPRSVLLLHQMGTGVDEPYHMPEHTLAADHFVQGDVRFVGLKLANTVPGYQFAVYRPIR